MSWSLRRPGRWPARGATCRAWLCPGSVYRLSARETERRFGHAGARETANRARGDVTCAARGPLAGLRLRATKSGVASNPRNSWHAASSYSNLEGGQTLFHGGIVLFLGGTGASSCSSAPSSAARRQKGRPRGTSAAAALSPPCRLRSGRAAAVPRVQPDISYPAARGS